METILASVFLQGAPHYKMGLKVLCKHLLPTIIGTFLLQMISAKIKKHKVLSRPHLANSSQAYAQDGNFPHPTFVSNK